MYEVMLCDERIGTTPQWDGMSGFTVSPDDPIERILSWVAACYRSNGQMEELGVQGHGYVQMYADGIGYGGHGVQFGKDDIYLRNVSKWRAIRGMAKWIIVYACNAADVDPLAATGAKTPVPAEIEPAYRELCSKYGAGKSTYELMIDKSNSKLALKLD